MGIIGSDIKTWKQFSRRVRKNRPRLLKQLDQFPNSILVAGCQRSGTTILSRVITHSEGMVNYWFGKDDELDAALILSGKVAHSPKGRYCFQTTYLNECYEEYFEHQGGYKLIWVLRNPYSVVYSLMYNWRRWTLNELFEGCGTQLLEGRMAVRYKHFGVIGVPRLVKACLAYNGKVSQLFRLKRKLSPREILVIEYDNMVNDVESQLDKIYRFVNLPYKKEYSGRIHKKSTHKKTGLSENEIKMVEKFCLPIYENAKNEMSS